MGFLFKGLTSVAYFVIIRVVVDKEGLTRTGKRLYLVKGDYKIT